LTSQTIVSNVSFDLAKRHHRPTRDPIPAGGKRHQPKIVLDLRVQSSRKPWDSAERVERETDEVGGAFERFVD
jgi:hypothetical protein